MSFFISDAMAAATTTAPASQFENFYSLIMIMVIFGLFYFMLIRPQNKRAKDQREMVNALKKGDEIITTGGIVAKVVSLDEQFIKISLAEGVEINLQRNAVSSVLPKGTIKSL